MIKPTSELRISLVFCTSVDALNKKDAVSEGIMVGFLTFCLLNDETVNGKRWGLGWFGPFCMESAFSTCACMGCLHVL